MMRVAAIDDFAGLRESIESSGFYTKVQFTNEFSYKLVCVSDRSSSGRLYGTSFQVFRHESAWFLVSFLDLWWRVPASTQIADVCVAWLRSRAGPGAPPDEIVQRYGLEAHVGTGQLEAEFADTFAPSLLRRIWTAQQEHRKRTHRYAKDIDEIAASGSPLLWPTSADHYTVRLSGDGRSWRASVVAVKGMREYQIDEAADYRIKSLTMSDAD